MGQQQSKDELLHQQVAYGNSEGIKALHSDGAGLEYLDREGKTPLITACMSPQLYGVAKTLLELGANVNSYRRGRFAGTPLHHAAKQGLDRTVKLLLSYGANAMVLNDDYQSPLEIARAKGYHSVVRTIESHICLFSGWLLELYGPGFLEILAPQLLSRKVWVAVLPCGSRNLSKPIKLELALYNGTQDAQPRMTIPLWKASMEEQLHQPDPTVIISESSTISRHARRRRKCVAKHAGQTRIKLAPVNESGKQQLQQFCTACRGIPQAVHPTFPLNTNAAVVPATAPPDAASAAEDVELAMAINASLQSAMEEGVLLDHPSRTFGASTSTSLDPLGVSTAAAPPQSKESCSQSAILEAGLSADSELTQEDVQASNSISSAPSINNEVDDDAKVQYPFINSSPVKISTTKVDSLHTQEDGKEGDESSCVICLDAPVEGACVPCGHMAGCIICLNEVKIKKLGCPICRAKIDQVIRVYAV